jgi:hypothetical protein
MTTSAIQSNDRLLRNTLRGNGVFSTISGVSFMLASAQIAAFLGVSPDAAILIALIGVGLLGFAAILFRSTSRQMLDLTMSIAAIAGDVLWVLGSLVILIADPFGFSTAGRWATLIIADAVATFAILQFIGLRRVRQ